MPKGGTMKKLVSLFLVLAMALGMLSGCGNITISTEASKEAAAPAEAEDGAEAASEEYEPYTVRIVADAPCTEEACEKVAAAMTEILKPLYNISVELVRYDFSVYTDSVLNALASGEKIDLLGGVSDLGIPSCARQGQVLALDDLLAEYGQDILADIPDEDLASTSYQGQIYAVRNNKELGTGVGFACNKEMLDATGIDYSNIKTEEEMEPILRKVKELYPDVYPWVSDTGFMDYIMYPIDYLGRDFGVLLNVFDDTTEVVNMYTTDEFYDICKRRYEWQQEGLIMPEASINPDSCSALVGAGKGFCFTTETKPGIESQVSRNAGVEMVVINMVDYYSSTSNLNNYWYIPYTSEKPERAMQALNEIYKNPDLENLLIYGLEGEQYEFVDKENGVIQYAEGADTSAWTMAAWHMPNELIAYKWVDDGKDIWDETIQFNKDCHPSPLKGFIWDSSNVTNEIVACTTVLNKYKKGLTAGDIDPDTVWDQMKTEFEDAGIQKILDEKQAQIDEWLANYK